MLALVFALAAAAEPWADLTVPQPVRGPWRAHAGDDPSWVEVGLGQLWSLDPELRGADVVRRCSCRARPATG